jgi:hypothetical protein
VPQDATPAKPARQPSRPRKTPPRASWALLERLAALGARIAALTTRRNALGLIGVGLVTLSVSHCKDALQSLTGMVEWQAVLFAVAIDAGLVGCEIVAQRAPRPGDLHWWAHVYVITAAVLSVLLNVTAFVLHGNPGLVLPTQVRVVADVVLGFVIPGLVYVLGRVVGYLSHDGPHA